MSLIKTLQHKGLSGAGATGAEKALDYPAAANTELSEEKKLHPILNVTVNVEQVVIQDTPMQNDGSQTDLSRAWGSRSP